jgi:hypothetical protein
VVTEVISGGYKVKFLKNDGYSGSDEAIVTEKNVEAGGAGAVATGTASTAGSASTTGTFAGAAGNQGDASAGQNLPIGSVIKARPTGLSAYNAVVTGTVQGGYRVKFLKNDGYAGSDEAIVTNANARPGGDSTPAPQAPKPNVFAQNDGSKAGQAQHQAANQNAGLLNNPNTKQDNAAGVPNPEQGSGGLDGLYLSIEQYFWGTSLSIQEKYYYFFPDGRVYNRVPPKGPSKLNWSQLSQSDPKNCGSYKIGGGQITFNWGGGKGAQTLTFARQGKDLLLNKIFARKVDQFAPGAKISGSYGRLGAASITDGGGTSVASSAASFYFKADGTFTVGRSAALDGDTKNNGISAGIIGQDHGTYSISGNDMAINYASGKSETVATYPLNIDGKGTMQTPERLAIGGALFKHQGN